MQIPLQKITLGFFPQKLASEIPSQKVALRFLFAKDCIAIPSAEECNAIPRTDNRMANSMTAEYIVIYLTKDSFSKGAFLDAKVFFVSSIKLLFLTVPITS